MRPITFVRFVTSPLEGVQVMCKYLSFQLGLTFAWQGSCSFDLGGRCPGMHTDAIFDHCVSGFVQFLFQCLSSST